MRSEILKRILDETPEDVREQVRVYGDALVRAYNLGFTTALAGCNKPVVMQGLPYENMADLYNELSGSPTVASEGQGEANTSADCDHTSLLWINSDWKYLCLDCGKLNCV